MSVTIGTLAGTTGLGSERQVVATASGDLWAFGFTGTATLATWYSQDQGATWTAGSTLALASNHLGEGRNLGAAYELNGTTDVVHVGIIYKSGTSLGARSVRATIAGTTITFHSSVTSVASATTDGGGLYFAGVGLELTSDNKVHFASGYAGGGNGDINVSDSSADAGSAEQATPITWTSHVVDSSVANENRSAYVVDLGSTHAGLIVDNASGAADATALDWHTWNGSAWNINNGNGLVTGGSVSAFDKNDWGCVEVNPNDIHAVYRDAGTGNLIHRRYDGTSWSDGQAIPAQNSLAGGGVAMMTDGACVWVGVIDTDSANTIRACRWTPISHNDVVDQWDATWAPVETSSATRTFLGCCRDVVAEVGVFYWTESSSLVSAQFAAVAPPDPAGAFIQSAQGSSAASATTFAVTFTTQNVVLGDSIIVEVAIWNGTPTTITSITDSAGNVYVKDKDGVLSDGTHGSQWRATITAGGGTKPTVTAHASAATSEWAMWIQEWANLSLSPSNYTDGSNITTTTTAGTPITSGASTPAPSAAGEIAIGFYFDGGNGIATIGVSAGWTQRGTSIQGSSTTAEGAVASQSTTAGVGSNASFTLSATGSPAGVLVVVYKLSVETPPGAFRWPGLQRYVAPRFGLPRLRWRQVSEEPIVSVGGTLFTTDLVVALASEVTMSRSIGKLLTVASTSSATQTKAIAKILPASTSSSSSLVKQVAKTLSVATSSAVTLLKTVGKVLSVAAASAVSITTIRAKLVTLSVATASAVSMTKRVSKNLSVATSSAVSLAKSVGKTLTAATTSPASLLKRVGKTFSVAASSAVTLTAIRTKLVTLAVVTAPSVSLVRQVGKSLSVATISSPSMQRAIGKVLAVATIPATSLVKRIAKTLAQSSLTQAILAAVNLSAGTSPVSPPVLTLLQQPGRAIVALFGQRTQASTGGHAGASTGGKSRAQVQEGRDDVEPQ